MKKLALSFIATLLVATASFAQGQISPASNEFIVLPDGKIIPKTKLDSIRQAWASAMDDYYFMKGGKGDSVLFYMKQMDKGMQQQWADFRIQDSIAIQAMIGKNAPDFKLKDITGIERRLKQQKGKVVVLNFWFTSCAPCVQEMPQLNKLTTKYDASQVTFMALTFNSNDEVKKFLSKHTFNYTLLTDSRTTDNLYNVSSWPTNIVINRDGKIVYAGHYDDHIDAVLSAAIDKAL